MFTTARPFAEYIMARDPLGSLVIADAPSEFEAISLHMLWHARTQSDAAVQWMRDVIRQAVRRMKIERAA